jgi:hypothetical protein
VFDEMDEIAKRITNALDQVDKGKVSALAEGDRILLMIQDAPDELRRLADAMEKIGVQEIKAFVAYQKPEIQELSVSARDGSPGPDTGAEDSEEEAIEP